MPYYPYYPIPIFDYEFPDSAYDFYLLRIFLNGEEEHVFSSRYTTYIIERNVIYNNTYVTEDDRCISFVFDFREAKKFFKYKEAEQYKEYIIKEFKRQFNYKVEIIIEHIVSLDGNKFSKFYVG